ncbi:antitoxin Xre/MbcA/ParS toxin-binding domain-containing protein [Pseudomonas sp.]|uniref:antitoxin Xre/MbcA/ParS toxin-binding domain-containing protein n=2 Tax=Pseudomonas TaxID=286 RepID=UPI003BB66752
MVSHCKTSVPWSPFPSSMHKVIDRILDKSKPKKTDDGTSGLNASQNSVAFQFAKVFEYATTVFGSQPLAEEWLQKPCRHLADLVPLTLVETHLDLEQLKTT